MTIGGSVSRRRVLVVALALLCSLTVVSCRANAQQDDRSLTDASSGTSLENPVLSGSQSVHNVAFYYRGKLALTPANAPALKARLGSPSVLVTTAQRDPQAAVEAIHQMGAKAYLYVQYFWAPSDREYSGINLADHPGWAFCDNAGRPLVGRVQGGEKWWFLDTNEDQVRSAIAALMAKYQQEGWDGVSFDRGAASTQPGIKPTASDGSSSYLWNAKSGCTNSPHMTDATFSDAFVNVLALARQAGLQVMVNNGRSPYDPIAPMRPNPRSAACVRPGSTSCRPLLDIWNSANLVLNETGGRTRLIEWDRTFRGNRLAERDQSHGKRTVVLLTTPSMGGREGQNRPTVFYVWSRVKLFNLAVGVNTGDYGCPRTHAAACNLWGAYPDLVDISFGSPISSGPTKQRCRHGSDESCVWTRRYSDGASLLNATPTKQTAVPVVLGTAGCRYVMDKLTRSPLAGNKCVTSVRVRMGAWSGHPLVYSTTRF